MELRPDAYQDVAHIYIAMIKKYNLEAGITIEQIHARVGARAAVLAALVVTLLRMEMMENYQRNDRSIYAMIVKDYPEALPLLNHAIECFSTWIIPDATIIYQPPVGSPTAATIPSLQAIDVSPDLPT